MLCIYTILQKCCERQRRHRPITDCKEQKRRRRAARQIVGDECNRASTLERDAKDPQIGAIANRIAERQEIANADSRDEDGVEIDVNGGNGRWKTEPTLQQVPEEQQRDTNADVVNERRRCNRSNHAVILVGFQCSKVPKCSKVLNPSNLER